MEDSQLSGTRLECSLDVYVTQRDGCLKHYYADSSTDWAHSETTIAQGITGRPAVIR